MTALKIAPKALLCDGEKVSLEARVSKDVSGEFTIHNVSVRLKGKQAARVDRIALFEVDLGAPSVEVYRQGFFMPSDACGFSVLMAGEKAPHCSKWKPLIFNEWEFTSNGVAVVDVPTRRSRQFFGFPSGRNFQSWFIFKTRGKSIKLTAWLFLEGIALKPGEWLDLEPLMVSESPDFNRLLDWYATYTARTNHARVPKKTVTGWNDWQYYRNDKCEADVLRSLKPLAALQRQGYPLKYIQIDGGWCEHLSEWLKPCAKFPSGMKKLSQTVRRKGFELGIWLAPYITNVKTDVARKHPDWLVKDATTDKPLFRTSSNVGPANVLDFTIPEAMGWLRGIVRTMVRDWKVGYIKLDGPNPGHYRNGVLRDPNVTTVQMIRRSLELIREECGEDVIVEGEGVYLPAIGMVDVQRTTQDNHPAWYTAHTGTPLMKENMKNDLLSSFMHGRFWHNHRENVILRDFLTEFHPYRDKHPGLKDINLSENEIRLQVSAATLGGGAMLLTDPMDQLLRNPDKAILISQFLPHYEGLACRPLDVFRGGRAPSVFFLPIRRDFEEWFVVGVFNWDDQYQDYTVPLTAFGGGQRYHAFDFWRHEYLGAFKGNLPATDVPPHGCRMMALRKVQAVPQLLGTDMHILQGAVDVSGVAFSRNTLTMNVGHFMQKDRRITVWHPAGWKLAKIETNAPGMVVDTRRKNLVTLRFDGAKETTFEMKWSAK